MCFDVASHGSAISRQLSRLHRVLRVTADQLTPLTGSLALLNARHAACASGRQEADDQQCIL